MRLYITTRMLPHAIVSVEIDGTYSGGALTLDLGYGFQEYESCQIHTSLDVAMDRFRVWRRTEIESEERIIEAAEERIQFLKKSQTLAILETLHELRCT